MTSHIHTCSKCHTNGNVIQHKGGIVFIECPLCFKRWLADSKICPKCKQPNGFAVEGICGICYSENYRSE